MSVSRLQELITSVPDHLFVEVNRVGNLAITTAAKDFVGIVDFNEELVNWMSDEWHKTSKQ